MHQEINKSRLQQGLCNVHAYVGQKKSPVRMLFKDNNLS